MSETNRLPDELILDVRPAAEFERLHRVGAVNIPLEELARRTHELPRRTSPVTVYDANETRARWARSRLCAWDRAVADVVSGPDWLCAGPTATGPGRGRLWQPHALLVKAVGHARKIWHTIEGRQALDIACGSGRDAVFLALSGFDTEAWDVLPDALAMCAGLAGRHGVTVATCVRDVEANPVIEGGRYDLVSCFNFLHRPLMPHIAEAVRPGGLVVYETFVHPQRALFGRPRREAHLLRPGELPTWFEDWEIVVAKEGMAGPHRFVASLVARKRLAREPPAF
ncbi:MAG: methyltransferase domain-containing protein [Phycisphaerae bacterium]|nr:methyltransferase domain-containing protein [Phycisphaerae bacterium]